MQCKIYLLCSSLLLVTLQLQGSAGHPVPDSDTDQELESFKGALERLESELDLLEALQTSPDSLKTRSGDRPQLVTPGESGAPVPDTRATRNNPIPESLLKGLRTLQNPRMMRGSGCFGRRIDRIDALSGLGCNGFRRY